jgi:GntR family transcriptional regulator, transcriptional repressor for pyruvate dehydrogenase complex
MVARTNSRSGRDINNQFSVSTRLVAQLLGLIDRGELQPGEQLPAERELAQKMKVSRQSLRAAIASLVMIGILKACRGVGTFVSPEIHMSRSDSPEMPRDLASSQLFEAKVWIEVFVSELAVHRIKRDQMGDLAGELAEMYSALDDPQNYAIHYERFHRIIARASGNAVLAAMLSGISTILDGGRSHSDRPPQYLRESAAIHSEIYRAIRSRNSSLAKILMEKHLRASRPPLQAAVDSTAPENIVPIDGKMESLSGSQG